MELWWHGPVLAVIGVLVGCLNVFAGGGSLLSLPAMVFMGMEGAVANGSNRVAILIQNLCAMGGFRQAGLAHGRLSLRLALMTVPGVVIGSLVGTRLNGAAFQGVLALVMLGVLIWSCVGRRRGPASGATDESAIQPGWRLDLTLVAIGFYGGFIQAGIGLLLMAALSLLQLGDLVRVNMHKVFIIAGVSAVSLAIFAARGLVEWWPGCCLGLGTAIGGYVGARLNVRAGEAWIVRIYRVVLIVLIARLVWSAGS